MNFLKFYQQAGRVPYPEVWLRFPLCLVVSNYLVVYGEKESVLEFLTMPYYYSALAVSFGVTLLVSEVIYVGTKLLDFYCDWLHHWYRRLCYQLFLGVVLPIVIVYFSVRSYFRYNDIEINDTNYLKYDLTVVVCFILMLNTYYLINYLLKFKVERQKQRFSNFHESKLNQGTAIVYSDSKTCVAITFEGVAIILDGILKDFLKELPSEDYFLINRSAILHRNCIIGFEPSTSKTLTLKLSVCVKGKIRFVVSQRRVVAFKRWYAREVG